MKSEEAADYQREEEEVYKLLLRIQRIVRIVNRLEQRKERIAKRIKSRLPKLKKGGYRLFRELAAAFESFLVIIRRQMKLLRTDMDLGEKEEEVVEDIQKSPLFSKLSPPQLAVLEEMVKRERVSMRGLVEHFKGHYQELEEQADRTVNSVDLYKKLLPQSKGEQHEAYLSYANPPSKLHSDHLERAERLVDHLLQSLRGLLGSDFFREVLYEEEMIERLFNEADLEELKAVAGEELKKETYKVRFIREYLKRQRMLRNPLHVNQLIAVHLTNHFPVNGLKVPASRFNPLRFMKGHTYLRETIHFSLNGVVTVNTGGTWTGKRCAILVPLSKMIDRVISLRQEDCYVVGKLLLPRGSEIIVLDERKLSYYRQRAGNAAVIAPRPGENVSDAVRRRIRERGYNLVRIGPVKWMNPDHDLEDIGHLFVDDATEGLTPEVWQSWERMAAGLGKELAQHADSVWFAIEDNAASVYKSCIEEPAPAQTIEFGIRKIEELKDRLKGFTPRSKAEQESVRFMTRKLDRMIKAMREKLEISQKAA